MMCIDGFWVTRGTDTVKKINKLLQCMLSGKGPHSVADKPSSED